MKAHVFFLIIIALAIISSLSGCATTRFYRDGKVIAEFQGNMKMVTYESDKYGAVRWSSSEVDHAAATKAQGDATAAKLSAAGIAVATSGLVSAIK